MKTRNYISIEFQNNFSMPKLTLRPLNYFLPHKTFSSGYNYSNKIINLKTSFGNTFSELNNTKYQSKYLSLKEKGSNLSKRNTYYKTNNFSPESTLRVYSSTKSIKEKYKKTEINKNKNSPLSFKKIEFINDYEKEGYINSINKRQNNIKYIFVGIKDPPKDLKPKKDNLESNIEISGQNLFKKKYEGKNKAIKSNNMNIFLDKNDIKTSLDFISYPNLNSTKLTKSKSIAANKKNQRGLGLSKLIKDIKNKPFEEYDEKISEYNYDNIINKKNFKNKAFYFNNNSSKKISVQNKNKKNSDIKDDIKEISIQTIDDKKFKTVNIENNNKRNLLNKTNKKKYELEADIDMFDPITLESNKNLFKDYLEKKEKEKIALEKLFENDKVKEIISQLENNSEEETKSKEENKISEINETKKNKNKDKRISFLKRRSIVKRDLKNFTIRRINTLFNDFFNKEYFKASDFINYISEKIYEDVDSFRNKNYDDITTKIIDNNISEFMNDIISKDPNKEKYSISNIFSRNEKKVGKRHIFDSQTRLNIKTEKNLINSKSNNNIKNNTINDSIKDNNGININFDENYLNTKGIQTQDIINESESQNNDENALNQNNKKKSFRTKIFNKNIKIKGKKLKTKKVKSFLSLMKSGKKKKGKNKNEESKYVEDIEKINNAFDNDKEKIEDKEIENEKNDKIEEIENDIKENSDYYETHVGRHRSKTLINRNKKFKFSSVNYSDKNEEKNEEIEQKQSKKDKLYLLDELYGFKEYKIEDDSLMLGEFDKINLDGDLKEKLIENMKQVMILIKKEPKSRNDYIKLHHCQKRIKYLIKKLSEKDIKKNLTNKLTVDLSFPSNLDDRKALYRLMRTIETKIREELSKYDDIEYEESESSGEETSYIKNLYEIFPNEEDEKELDRKISFADMKERKKKNLIYDNSYLFKNDEDDIQNTEIKKEVYDILNPKKSEDNLENEDKSKEIDEPPRSPRFFIKRRRKFKKTRKQTIFKKLSENEENKQEKKPAKLTLDHRINNFFEQIQKLKEENIEEVDYDKILKEIMTKQGDNYIEENIIKEIRLLNFFRYFQTKRKIELDRKNNFKNKYSFNSPINFRKNKAE